jgi:hypothetical protein
VPGPQQAEYFWEQARNVDLGFVRICGAALALSVHEECLQWTRALTAAMREVDEATAAGLRAKMAALNEALSKVGGGAMQGGFAVLVGELGLWPWRNILNAVSLHRRRPPPPPSSIRRPSCPSPQSPQDPSTLEELKGVLSAVAAVRGEGMLMELRCQDLEERYRTRLLYAVRTGPAPGRYGGGTGPGAGGIAAWPLRQEAEQEQRTRRLGWASANAHFCAPPLAPSSPLIQVNDAAAAQLQADLDDACRIASDWAELTRRADARDCELEQVKRRFGAATSVQAAELEGETRALAERLKAQGPGAPGVALAEGLELLHSFLQVRRCAACR